MLHWNTATKVMVFLLVVFPFSAMVVVPILVAAIEVELYKVAPFLTIWALVPTLVQFGTLILVVIKMAQNEIFQKDLNRWWNLFGLVRVSCNHIGVALFS